MCTMNQTVDLLKVNGSAPSGIDLSVVNVVQLASRFEGECSFDVMDTESSAFIKNGLFVVNVSLDLSLPQYADCEWLTVSVFDSATGGFSNVSIAGFVNITNANLSQFSSVKLSTFFGALRLYNSSRILWSSGLYNLSSSL